MKGCMISIRTLCLFGLIAIIQAGFAEQAAKFAGQAIVPSAALENIMQQKADNYQLFQLDIDALRSLVLNKQGDLNYELDFGTHGNWAVNLDLYDPRSSNYVLRVGTANGITTAVPQRNITWRGKIAGQKNSDVRMTLSENLFRLFIRDADGEQYYLESLDEQSSPSQKIIALYKVSALTAKDNTCQTASIDGLQTVRRLQSQRQQMQKTAVCQQAELAIIVDYLAYEKADGGVPELEVELLSILNLTNAYFTELELEYKLVETFISTDQQSDPWVNIGADAGALLDEVDTWVAAGNMQHWHDLATFYTGHETGFSYAWVGSVGTYWRHHLVEYWGSGNDLWMASFVAHESGHNWGAGHVERSNQWIMSPTLYGGTLNWHSTTQSNFPNYIDDVIQHLGTCDGVVTSTGDGNGSGPEGFVLAQNFPNPFNPATKIAFTLPTGTAVTLTVYDVNGRQIAVLINEFRDAGSHEVSFEGSNLPGGVYFYRLQAGSFTQTRKMMLIR